MGPPFSETKTESSKQESVTVDNKTVLVNGVRLKVGELAAGPWAWLFLYFLTSPGLNPCDTVGRAWPLLVELSVCPVLLWVIFS